MMRIKPEDAFAFARGIAYSPAAAPDLLKAAANVLSESESPADQAAAEYARDRLGIDWCFWACVVAVAVGGFFAGMVP